MQRYNLVQKGGWDAYGEMDPDDTGDYVLHSEAQARIEALEAALRDFVEEVATMPVHYPYQTDQYIRCKELFPYWKKAKSALEKQP